MSRRILGVRAAALLAGCVLLGGCGGSSSNPATTTAANGTTATAASTTIATYFFRQGALTRVPVIPAAPDVATSALEALLAGPPAGFETAIPTGVALTSVSIVDGTATAVFSSSLGTPTHAAQGQIVLTLLQFPAVRRVALSEAGAGPVTLQDPAGNAVAGEATRADYVDLLPDALIFVGSPARGATVSSPIRAAGTADTFEATFQVDVVAGGKVVRTQTITATSGSGVRGTWTAAIAAPAGDVTLVFYEASAKDGSHIHTTLVPLHVR